MVPKGGPLGRCGDTYQSQTEGLTNGALPSEQKGCLSEIFWRGLERKTLTVCVYAPSSEGSAFLEKVRKLEQVHFDSH